MRCCLHQDVVRFNERVIYMGGVMVKTSAINRRLVCLAVLCLAFNFPADAATVTTHPKLAAFSAIRLSGQFRLNFTRSARQTISLSGAAGMINALRVSVSDGVLSVIGPTGNAPPRDQTITVTIAAPSLGRADFNGLVRARMTGLTGQNFSLDNHGSAAATISGNVRKCRSPRAASPPSMPRRSMRVISR